MNDTAHHVYTAAVRQINGLIAERDALLTANAALTAALAAKREQVAGLVAERDEWREQWISIKVLGTLDASTKIPQP